MCMQLRSRTMQPECLDSTDSMTCMQPLLLRVCSRQFVKVIQYNAHLATMRLNLLMNYA